MSYIPAGATGESKWPQSIMKRMTTATLSRKKVEAGSQTVKSVRGGRGLGKRYLRPPGTISTDHKTGRSSIVGPDGSTRIPLPPNGRKYAIECSKAGAPPEALAECATMRAQGLSMDEIKAAVEQAEAEGVAPVDAPVAAAPSRLFLYGGLGLGALLLFLFLRKRR